MDVVAAQAVAQIRRVLDAPTPSAQELAEARAVCEAPIKPRQARLTLPPFNKSIQGESDGRCG